MTLELLCGFLLFPTDCSLLSVGTVSNVPQCERYDLRSLAFAPGRLVLASNSAPLSLYTRFIVWLSSEEDGWRELSIVIQSGYLAHRWLLAADFGTGTLVHGKQRIISISWGTDGRGTTSA